MKLILLLCLPLLSYAIDNIICPDGKSMCFESQTCCIMTSGNYGCCPLPQAVCCSDRTHCCPTNYKCNLQSVTCDRQGRQIPMLKHENAREVSNAKEVLKKTDAATSKVTSHVQRVICPGGRDYCEDGSTCCTVGKEEYACCPIVDAVCCKDNVHCCPNGYTCDLTAGGCIRKDEIVPLKRKSPAKRMASQNVMCPKGRATCPDGNTCCEIDEGDFGCCPMPNAVCCSDKEHCCPNGFTCNVEKSRCMIGGLSVPMLKKVKPRKYKSSSKENALMSFISHGNQLPKPSSFCPDHKSSCPDGFTCCLTKGGHWGCCPLPSAQCCSDGEHCCPHGSTCDLVSMHCKPKHGLDASTAITKLKEGVVICPDGISECQTGYTCCLLSSGMYGCCPYSNAVCCSDHIHCCPHGTKCDTTSGMCLRQKVDKLVKLENKQPTYLIRMLSNDDIVCPDKVSSCPSGSTCCKLATGGYGCCPLPKAVCCSDGVHCCPNGTTCDLSSGRCPHGDGFPAMVKKIAATPISQNEVCPDGKSSCPSGSTCCKLATSGYGCCPLPKAVCCSDGKHCCPHGTTCDLSSGRCLQGNGFTAMVEKIAATPVSDNEVCPDGKSSCPSGSTCCKLATSGYGCCPLPKAVCCSDGKHCCPHGTTCDLSSGRCLQGNGFTAMVEKVAATPVSDNEVCPDGKSSCPSGSTCCKLATGGYGCCPLPKAVCCSDGKHCCPHGTTCDLSSGRCLQGKSFTAMVKKIAATPISQNEVCPDGKSSCPSGSTCCKLATGGYGCCPLPKAVCCSDGKHCCPHGTTCDLSSGRCLQGNGFTAMVEKVAATPVSDNEVCPDGKSSCPSGSTCCKLATGGYGCCPLPKAVCCSDGKHCCPHGTTCDLSSGRCLQGKSFTAMVKKIAATPISQNEVCPDGKSSCPSGSTCCKLATGGYGCCPLPKAVCCSDGKHCCPHGTTCDLSSGRCLQGKSFTALVKKIAATPVSDNEVCPDGKSSCPSGSTCCKLATSGYGCCPLPKAVCCSDGKHCCPHGTTCDLSSGRCLQGKGFTAMVKKIAATPISQNEVCPDGKTSCPSGSTCCKLATSGYGCCPLPKAVCCSDGKHCCPHGTTCDLSSGRCLQGKSFTAMVKKIAATPVSDNEVCPDGKSSCPSGSTCCKLATSGYGCCPLPKAVCCSDGKHCCPHGTTCDLSSGRCLQGKSFTALVKKIAATPVSDNEVCPDGKSSCPSGSTCCKLATSGYGCCPLPKAVCCSDGKHCCPHGTTCDLSSGRCLQGKGFTAMVKKIAATPISQNEVCPDGKSSCPSGSTCCKLATGGYGCCPLPKAVCCTDGKHCCPHGTTCDLSSGRCLQGKGFTALVKKIAATPISQNEVCPDGKTSCPSGSTCCKLATSGYGCCPLPKAVCCSDGKHCCPHGTTCDLSSGRCLQGDGFTAMVKKIAATPVSDNKICPDGKSSCPSGNTCCKLASGQYGCCLFPKAVCCSDGVHCCPNGYSCSSSGFCSKGGFKVKAAKHVPAISNNVVCPDGLSQCPSGNTCCKLASGQYGCCPLPKAVCCSDGVHCCPHGTTCDLSSGRCLQGDGFTAMVEKIAATPISQNEVCPDGKSSCPSGNTCCKLASGQYGCCPFPKAVCCSDGVHCCPNGYSCSSSGFCSKGGVKVKAAKHVPAISNNVVCPDGVSQCPSGTTCCKTTSGQYGCCPFPKAVCCSDGVHCCPNGYSCSSSGFCSKGGFEVKAAKHVPAISNNVVCPDGVSQCPSGNTCCKLASSQYGCCPLPHAVCCSDGVHCCPNGYSCSSGFCSKGGFKVKAAKHVPAISNSVVCPDGVSQCPSGTTCCKTTSGQYGCCPFPKAVCCSDGVHCCPNGYSCSSGFCSKGGFKVKAAKHVPAISNSVVCPDGVSQCPSGTTCCKTTSGQYGCCPFPKAVCCSDGVHCCPNGYSCSSGFCSKGGFKVKAAKHVPAISNSVVCPDGVSQCPSGTTCCKTTSGQYGCCPFPKAVCCSDGVHCCPNGYSCSSGFCSKGGVKVKAAKHVPAISNNVVCPDGVSQCPSGNTCCKLASGQYGCCPFPKAVCCSDGVHCCPNGYSCSSSGFCSRGEFKVKAAKHVPAISNNVVCPDGVSQCPSGTTCCKTTSGQYGCCPFPKAVCCSDGVHCCPNGYSCSSSGFCTKGGLKAKAAKHIPAVAINEAVKRNDEKYITCPDKKTVCVAGTTCCQDGGKVSFSCCPIKDAICCKDHIHCCPNGWKCDIEQGTCYRSKTLEKIPFLRKLPGKKIIADEKKTTDDPYIRF